MPHEGDPGEDGVDGFRAGTDAFAFALGYYEGDYKPVNPNVTVSDSRDQLWDRYRDTRDTVSAAGLYNGNISWMSTDLPGLGSNRMQAMVYGYDQLHRIVQARSLTAYGSTGYAQRGPGAEAYDVDYSYDPNGNLLTLQRLDDQTDIKDSLVYEYNTGTNRLRNTDPADGENYAYDEIGNLISDAEEGIAEIQWTPYGKVRKVEKADNSSVRFRYDAAGNRVAKIASGDTTLYVRDASGNVMGVYKNDTLIEQSIYGSSRLGLMTSSSKTGYRTMGGKKYELSNHLGNVLAVVTDNIHLDQDSTWAQVVNVTDYYPFGLGMDGRTVEDSSYRYGFNGFEKDDEIKGTGSHLSWGDYGYDPRVVVRWSPDKHAAKYPWHSPYSAMGNNPVLHQELDGKDYAVYINHDTKTVIIKATYYTIAGDESTYHSAVQATQIWNEQSGKYRYIVGKGSDAVTYDVHFELNIMEVDNPTQEANTDRMSPEMAESLGKTKLTPDQSSNTYGLLPDDDKKFENGEEGKSTNGVATAGALINVKESRKNTDTGAHEIGHTLGLAHFKKGVLTAASNDPNRSKSISSGYIKGIISNAIKKKDERVGKGTLHETGISPGIFKKGKIEKK